VGFRTAVVVAALVAASGCAEFGAGSGDDGNGRSDAGSLPLLDDAAIGPDARVLGTQAMPAADCAALRDDGAPSGVGWVQHPDGVSPAFPVYCEQEIDGGGWAMLYNSVLREDGTTTAFWQFDYASRLGRMGTAAPDENYYHGALYLIGTEYIDVMTDLAGTTVIAARVSASGFDQASMAFIAPTQTEGNGAVFDSQFAAGWSAKNHDADTYTGNCATMFSDVAQHYSACWNYNLGSDADTPVLDGGVGPHVNNTVLGALGLVLQPDGGSYSRVSRIARFTRW
jgi:hypothetical protein